MQGTLDRFLSATWSYGLLVLKPLSIFVAFWVTATIISRVVTRFADDIAPQASALKLIVTLVRLTLLSLGAVTALGTAGVDVSALVASLGLTGFALGFAFRDALSNFIAGLLILFYRPFEPGDQISVAGFQGIVQSIDLRYTILKGQDAEYLIPNSLLFNNPITVNRAQPQAVPGK